MAFTEQKNEMLRRALMQEALRRDHRDEEDLLRRIPENIKQKHDHDDEVHIYALLDAGDLVSHGGMELAAATIPGLILTVSHQDQIGNQYPQVLDIPMNGACQELFG